MSVRRDTNVVLEADDREIRRLREVNGVDVAKCLRTGVHGLHASRAARRIATLSASLASGQVGA